MTKKLTIKPWNVVFVFASLTLLAGCQPSYQTEDSTELTDTTLPPSASPAPAPPAAALANVEVAVGEPNAAQTVMVGMATDQTSLKKGASFTLGVRLRIASGWHIYAVESSNGVNIPTTLKLALPPGLKAVGDWDIPKPHAIDATTLAYDKDVIFRQLVEVTAEASEGDQEIACEVGYQSCSDSSCLRPTKENVLAKIEIVE